MKKNPFSEKDLAIYLEEKHDQYNRISFIDEDPVSIPHLFSKKEDIEISGLFAATLAWGQRKTIVSNSKKLMNLMDGDPHDFILNHTSSDLIRFEKFSHRTFNSADLIFFIRSIKNIYSKKAGLQGIFEKAVSVRDNNIGNGLILFRKKFFELPHLKRTEKHISSPEKNSSCKRLNMFLRWMVRKDKRGVDFGIWTGIRADQLICPLDVHSGRVARNLGLLYGKQNNWKAALELTDNLKKISAVDPVKFDFALFGLGVNSKEKN